jgi:pyridoxamine 5'-phosphate oxidase
MADSERPHVAPDRFPDPLPPWRSPLARALHRNRSRPHSRYFQLATVTATGRPANRTVVFRGFWSQALAFVTDQRSAKVTDIAMNPWGEICWYFTQTREQFRLGGALTLVTEAEEKGDRDQWRQQVWQSLSPKAQAQFYWPQPGHPRQGAWEPVPEGDRLVPPTTFVLALLQPETVDHLELRGEPQTRTRYHQNEDGQWQTKAVNP